MMSVQGIPFRQGDGIPNFPSEFVHKFRVSNCDRPIYIMAPDKGVACELMHEIMDDCLGIGMDYPDYHNLVTNQ